MTGSDKKARLLVTGGSGFLGWNLCAAARKAGWEVFATWCGHRVEIPDAKTARVDLTDFRDLRDALDRVRPAAIVHTAAASQPNFCQEHPAETRRINTDATINLAGLCADRGIPLAFTSTDLVFDGRRTGYREEDPVSPVSIYAEQKVDAERGVLERHPAAAVCRMPLMFGVPGPHAQSFIQPFIRAMREGKELRLFVDEYRTPVNGATASAGLLLALEKVHGLIHLGGRERVSRHEFGVLIAEVLELRNARISECRQKDVPMPAPRPSDVSLDSSRAYALGYDPKPLRDQLEEIKHLL
jgi:dTDP-4-dehydrorhamnose reductase